MSKILEIKVDECLWGVLYKEKDNNKLLDCVECNGYAVDCKNFISYKLINERYKIK